LSQGLFFWFLEVSFFTPMLPFLVQHSRCGIICLFLFLRRAWGRRGIRLTVPFLFLIPGWHTFFLPFLHFFFFFFYVQTLPFSFYLRPPSRHCLFSPQTKKSSKGAPDFFFKEMPLPKYNFRLPSPSPLSFFFVLFPVSRF